MRKKLKRNPELFIKFFFEFFWSPVSRTVPKSVKGGPLGVFEHPFFCKIEKKSHKAEITCTKKFWSRAGREPTSFCLADLKKASLNSLLSASSLYAVSGSQLIKLIKSVTSLILKKRKVITIVCVFLRKAPTKKKSLL